jgi:hypothetical protein
MLKITPLLAASVCICLFLQPAYGQANTQMFLKLSFDGSEDHEIGRSVVPEATELGANVALSLVYGLNDGLAKGKNSRVMDPNEEGYVADPAPTGGGLALATSLEFIQKGGKALGGTIRFNYLNAIQDILYRYRMDNGGSVFGGLGAYAGYGVGGRATNGNVSESSFSSAVGYKRFDAGLHAMAGYTLPFSLQLSLEYEYSLVNKSSSSDFGSENRTWSIDVGYSIDKIIQAIRK